MATSSVKLLDQHQFDKYAAAWSRHVSHHQDLTSVFQQPDGSPLRALSLSFEALQYLLSTVGARRIKAQFLLKKDDQSGEKLFTVALYATDALGGRISAYYQTQYLPAPPAPVEHADDLGETMLAADDPGTQIPNALVQTWVTNWKNASSVTAAMFGSNYGPLTGYTFDIGDFLNSFFYANKFKNKELLLLFGLHQHYPAYPDCYALKQTFGLVLRIHQLPDGFSKTSDGLTDEDKVFLNTIQNTTTHTDLVRAIQLQAAAYGDPVDPVGQPFYDYSKPSPPY
ncbi:MAG: hypothetical protein ACRYG7_28185 [Janthinobacterium lividum]